MLLEGKNAVVTGCLRGIGRTVTELFVRQGADVIAFCEYETEEWNTFSEDLRRSTGREIRPVYCDFYSEEAVLKAVETVRRWKLPIDLLVNVAGIKEDALFFMILPETMKHTFQVNFFSPMLLTQYIAKLMLRNPKEGKGIINVSSMIGMDGNVGQVSYAASKAALIAATKCLSAELAPQGIRVNAVAPGVIDTAMIADIPQDKLDALLGRAKIRRPGRAEEVAELILFLASGQSSYITGQTIRVDGGIL